LQLIFQASCGHHEDNARAPVSRISAVDIASFSSFVPLLSNLFVLCYRSD
jgi:hypothetical protein